MRRFRSAPLSALVLTALAAGSLATATPASAAKAKKPATITVLVTNDDGVGAPGIDVLVEALRKQKNTKLVVVAPDTNKSGSGGKTTPGPLTTTAATTASGYDATAVVGFPADTITAALDQLGVKPNVVLSGINQGQNLGGVVDLSGTVGAARAASSRGIPALALSQGLGDAPQYDNAAKLAVDWLAKHRTALAKKPKSTALATIDSYNVPNCPTGKPRGVKKVELATTSDNAIADVDCSAAITSPTNDIEAFNSGWAAYTKVPTTPATPAA
ncbi:MAG TPA: 5'/3'-nucleotidase SurE [Acidimicrobiia bacterium]|nr:5'/3'-nucleotidase SurE [Acidimicrobiia bacterium]